MRTGVINRDLTVEEYNWLSKPIAKGTKVSLYIGCTYGCISPAGEAISYDGMDGLFTEVPWDAVDWLAEGEWGVMNCFHCEHYDIRGYWCEKHNIPKLPEEDCIEGS
ncbi:MAG TPA: hypothetical protein DCZ10_10760, partial [Pelotomaculum sp.]|nr:hypothetical protein [Pelotomaculum sp.]